MIIDGPQKSAVDALEFEKLTALINAHPQSAELSVSFRKEYLEALLLEWGSPDAALQRLSTSLKAHEGLQKMEQKMDKKLFVELVKSVFFCVSGTTPDGRPILWCRLGYYTQKLWSVRTNSAEFWSYVRAFLFGCQAALRTLQETSYVYPSVYYDNGEAKNLGFNLAFMKTLAMCVLELLPVQECQDVVFGGSKMTEVVVRFFNYSLSGSSFKVISGSEVESVHPYVKDKSCIPSYMIEQKDFERDGNEGTTSCRKDPGFSWCYKRLVQGGPSIRAGEVFNAQPGESYEDDSEEDRDSRKELESTEALEVIEEDEADEGW